MEHTPEPWEVGASKASVVDNNKIIAMVDGKFTVYEERKANAKRIVACVNACAGMEDPIEEIASLRRKIAELERWKQEASELIDPIMGFEHPDMKLGESKVQFILNRAKR